MSTADCIAFAIDGTWDNFDHPNNVIDFVRKALNDAEIPVEMHPGSSDEILGLKVGGHLYDPADEINKKLDAATQFVDAARLLTQEALALIP